MPPGGSTITGLDPLLTQNPSLSPEEERSWLYYLAEISLRRIMNRILEEFYSRRETWWNSNNFSLLLAQYRSFLDELILWRQHIPHQLQFDEATIPGNEFAFFLKGRYYMCHEWIQRPFLYYILHQPPNDLHRVDAVPIAQKCLQNCSTLITIFSHHHRHGAIWSVVRRSLSCALLLLAAARKGFEEPLVDWKAQIEITLQTMAKWEREAIDLQWAKRVLQDIMQVTLDGQGFAV
ncbi:predicted protein [Uncinocarpus reesii 1704]|uniref:Transcription factor domain-containing protein n=1 Tax=Uncinocarpus reesii (strain UAMH 1704) TaxID=336963 RepID=C4JLV4_UNCRE|nr:uncharacterized protein UREG_03812 [Uncinocarpus reesii 1704]EEP78966.1 predicted protein [Uncinocarpus reesii 1704]